MNWLALLLILHLGGSALWIGGMAFALLIMRPAGTPCGWGETGGQMTLRIAVLQRLIAMISFIMPMTLATGWIMAFLAYGQPMLWPWALNAMQMIGLVMGGLFLLVWFGPFTMLHHAAASADTSEMTAQSERIIRLLAISCGLGGLTLMFGALLQY